MCLLKKLILTVTVALAAHSFAQPVEVVWWDFLGGGDGVRMKSMIEAFNAEHPDIRINATTLEWGVPYYTRVQTAVPVGEGPDIMTYHTSRLPLGAPSGIFRPFSDEELASVGLSRDDYFPAVVEAATIEGELLCAPLDIHAHILYYNRDILSEVGLIGEDGLPTGLDGIENFNTALQRIQEHTGNYALSFGADAGTTWRIFYTLLNQQNANILEGNDVIVGEEALRALDTMRGWIADGLAPELTEYPASIALFTSGQAAMHLNGVWEVPTMVDLAAQGQLFDWGAVAYPVLFDEPATWADSHCFAVPNNPRGPLSEEKLAAVLEVISWMNQNSIMWATAGHIPAYLPVVESDEYQQMEPNATYAVLGENAVFDPSSPVAGVASPIYDAVENLFVPAVNGMLPVEEALQMFEQEVESQLR
jgi:multiple sugar transport system substrate-binding protein